MGAPGLCTGRRSCEWHADPPEKPLEAAGTLPPSIYFLHRGMWRATESFPTAVQTTASSADPNPSIARDLD